MISTILYCMNQNSDYEHLYTQILQLKEAIVALENQVNGVPAIQPEELWDLINDETDDTKPIHPRLEQIMCSHVDLDSVKRGLKRLENDLNDIGLEPTEMYDSPVHELEGEADTEWMSDTVDSVVNEDEEENQQPIRDKNQRPLSAYSDEFLEE